ncbi:MAG: ATP synthase F1 subunit delta [Bacteroidetes bacterium]|jgi:F-type H+-transporting ATPase subunit delta|nr:ATP synthase F1 subunit delta [Bacteroidota bacterium]
MNEGPVAVRYAKALFESASEKQALDKVYADLNLLEQTLSENDQLIAFLASPVISASKKNETLKAIFKEYMSPVTLSLFQLVIHNKRANLLDAIARSYMRFYREKKNIQTVRLITATDISNHLKTKIVDLVKQVYHSEIELSEKIDDRIIGGFIMRVGDMQFDASISNQLKKIKQELSDSSVQNIN